MQIHVVKAGDTLWRISQAYSVNIDNLIQSNEIENPDRLVIGQAIVIPIWGEYYWVQPGDTLYKIGQQFNISVAELARINRIANVNQIPVGLRLYIPPTPRTTVDCAAYIDPRLTGDNSVNIVNDVGDELTYLNIFSYAINTDGSLNPVDDQALINAAYNNQIVPLMVLTNFSEGTFSQELATTILTNEALQDQILAEAIAVMEEKGYLGLDFDFEYLGAENRERYTQFLSKAADVLRARGYSISAALAPKTSAEQIGTLYEGHDYQAIGEIVDFIFFMTYEWGWSGSPPMAVAPINKVSEVMEYAVSVVPKNKVMMGIPLYGYDWKLPYVRGGEFARSISPQQAIELAATYGATIEFDTTSQTPHFNYYDEQGIEHEVWFEDARSIQAKFDLVKELEIRGFFYWVLGYDFPQNWLLIQENFFVRKRV